MNLAAAKVRAGDTGTVVTLTMPQWTDLSSLVHTRCRARLSGLTFTLPETAVAAAAAVTYGLGCRTELAVRRYPFTLKTAVAKNNTASKLADKFAAHMANAAAYFPLQRAVPRIYYVDEDVSPDDPHYEVELPPRSLLFTSDPNVLLGLGFTGRGAGVTAPWEAEREIGGRLVGAAQRVVYGFDNRATSGPPEVLRGEKILPGQSVSFALPLGSVLGDALHFQVEFYEQTVDEPVALARRTGVTKNELIVGLTRLVELARIRCNLRNAQLEVLTGPNNTVQLVSRAWPGCKTRLVLTLDDELSDAIAHPRQLPLIFDLEQNKTFNVEAGVPPQTRPDPFRNRYPVKVVVRGFGPARSHVDGGRGYVSYLGRIEERRGVIPAEGVGLEIVTDKTSLTVEFLDMERKAIAFDREMNLNFEFDFVRLVV